MNKLSALVTAELRKVVATRSTWLLVALAGVCCAAFVTLEVVLYDVAVVSVYSMAGQGYVVAMIVGILVVAGEYRHRTMTWAFLVTPRRSRVITAKLLACGVVGLAIGVLAAAVTVPLALILLSMEDGPLFAPGVPLALLGTIGGTGLWCVFGASVAALVRNQTAAVAVALVWTLYAEWFLVMLVPAVGRWAPSGAARAATGWTRAELPVPGELLPMWAGAVVFLAYTVVLAALARTTTRRDVT
ncbi:ABC transporter permease subunit [Actinophytocola gossypii]|uniref:ABC transporter permease subunit n=1 Tax=Actinophytocola gossypii TaxID=2812003 RepID=A0ABT2JAI1_9PSEU|nr:ABC transporter permease subunit [Actinophytocola gossypii]MCT2584862.1 ABC transporter permease subunit [Actinophytocola gossypii]